MYYSTVAYLAVCPWHVHRSRDNAGARPLVSRWPLAFSPSLARHSSVSVTTLVLIRQRKLTFTHTFAPRRPHSSSAGHTSSSSNSSDITVILDLDSVKEA
jgi:hypothetical protein